MWEPEADRLPLEQDADLEEVTDPIRDQGTLPIDALILDEDMPGTRLLQAIRPKQLRYKNGRGAFGRYRRVEVLHAAHLFSTTDDRPLLEWCRYHRFALMTANVTDFERLDRTHQHCGLIFVLDQGYPGRDPTGCAQKLADLFRDHTKVEMENNQIAIQSGP